MATGSATGADIVSLLTSCPELEELTIRSRLLSEIVDLPDEELAAISSLPRTALTLLNIQNCDINEEFRSRLLSRCLKLTNYYHSGDMDVKLKEALALCCPLFRFARVDYSLI